MSKHGQAFVLHEGDRVWFKTMQGHIKDGELVKRPYGRRLWAIVRTDDDKIHYLPGRDHIIRLANPEDRTVNHP